MRRLIFGCGYVGLPVAKAWQSDGDEVFAVTRSTGRAEVLEKLGLKPIVGDVTQPSTLSGLPKVDTLLVAIGMDRTRYENIHDVYVGGLKTILNLASHEVAHLIYVSSTGVYGDFNGEWVNENSPTEPTRDGGKACLAAEQLLSSGPFADRTTVLRLAGIYGPARVPSLSSIRSRQCEKLNPEGYLNLIHLSDIVRVIQTTASLRPMKETFLVSDGSPAIRRDYYETLAREVGVGEIDWPKRPITPSGRASSNKRVANNKLLEALKFELEFPSFRTGLKDALQKT